MAEVDTAVLAALDTLAGAAIEINAQENASERRVLDREQEMKKLKSQQDFQAEQNKLSREAMITQTNAALVFEHGLGNLEKNEDTGFLQPIANYNANATIATKTNDLASVKQWLDANRIAYDPSEDFASLSTKKKSYNYAFANAINFTGPTLSFDIHTYSPDKTPTALTEDDVTDFDDFIKALDDGYADPRVLDAFIGTGVVQEGSLHVDENGLPSVYRINYNDEGEVESRELDKFLMEDIEIAWQGFKQGLTGVQDGQKLNTSYYSSTEWIDRKNTEIQNNMTFAAQMMQNPEVQLANAKHAQNIKDVGAAIGKHYDTEDGKMYMNWRGQPVEYSDIKESIMSGTEGSLGKLSGAERQQLVLMYEAFASTAIDGTGIQDLIERVNANPGLIDLINKVDGTIATRLLSAQKDYNTVFKVSQGASNLYENPYNLDNYKQINTVDQIVETSGLRDMMLNYRGLLLKPDPNNTTWVSDVSQREEAIYSKIDEILTTIEEQGSEQVRQKGGQGLKTVWKDKELEDLHNKLKGWIELEESTFELLKIGRSQ